MSLVLVEAFDKDLLIAYKEIISLSQTAIELFGSLNLKSLSTRLDEFVSNIKDGMSSKSLIKKFQLKNNIQKLKTFFDQFDDGLITLTQYIDATIPKQHQANQSLNKLFDLKEKTQFIKMIKTAFKSKLFGNEVGNLIDENFITFIFEIGIEQIQEFADSFTRIAKQVKNITLSQAEKKETKQQKIISTTEDQNTDTVTASPTKDNVILFLQNLPDDQYKKLIRLIDRKRQLI